jgi:hypothetical protein
MPTIEEFSIILDEFTRSMHMISNLKVKHKRHEIYTGSDSSKR